MSEKFSLKALKEKTEFKGLTINKVKEFAKATGMIDENGKITEKGVPHLEVKHRKTDMADYLAITENFARLVNEHFGK